MKIAMFGPGYGHNIKPYLDFFEKNSDYDLDFYYHTKANHIPKYKKVIFLKFTSNAMYLLFTIRKYDIIWLMGGGRLLYIIAFIQLFKKKKSLSILNVWSEKLPRQIISNTLKGKIASFFATKFSIINCNWYGTAQILKNKHRNKVQVNPLGLIDDYYDLTKQPDSYLSSILSKINQDFYNFFYPKSFTVSSRHDLIIEAVKILKENGLTNFKVYFLEGNVVNQERKIRFKKLISEYNLEKEIILLPNKRFFETKEFNLFWKKMDCGLQIAEFDQLSNTIFEPLINKKEIIITDILPYHYIEDFFEFKLNLVKLNAQDIADEMNCKINNICITNNEEKERIKNLIQKKYSFNKNLTKILKNLNENI